MVRCFDRLSAENSVEKIKTIGDRYMAVGGLTCDSRGQAVATAKIALAILRSQADLSLGASRYGSACTPAVPQQASSVTPDSPTTSGAMP
jgi:class 3 adenylate cyclase